MNNSSKHLTHDWTHLVTQVSEDQEGQLSRGQEEVPLHLNVPVYAVLFLWAPPEKKLVPLCFWIKAHFLLCPMKNCKASVNNRQKIDSENAT